MVIADDQALIRAGCRMILDGTDDHMPGIADSRAVDDRPELGPLGGVLPRAKDHQVIVPTYPGFEFEVEELRPSADHHGPLHRRDAAAAVTIDSAHDLESQD